MAIYVHVDELRRFTEEVFQKVGVSEEGAKIIADHFAFTNLRGIDSHGIMRTPYYIKGFEDGLINPRPKIRTIREGKNHILLDGDRSLGHIPAMKVTEIAIKKAEESGISIGGVVNLRHVGALSHYVSKVVERGFIGISLTNGSPRMALIGFKKAVVGTNPISIGFPREREPPIILDMATSVAAMGKIVLAAKKGEKVPDGWGINKDGRVTNDPKEIIEGSVLPLGGYKGFGLAVAIDILCSVVLGGEYGLRMERTLFSQGGFVILVIDINNFRPYKDYLREIEGYIDALKSTPTMDNVEVILAGELEYRTLQERIRKGIPIDDETFNELSKLSKRMNITPLKILV
ncbi:MAG: Ldh family oxidoreductase [Nitrososphaerales archaeon]|nr:Ldh family oxidoreductase [Nitrososphaerales archaeon]